VIGDARDTPAYWETRARPFLGGAQEWRAVSVEGSAAVARLHMRLEARGVRVLEGHLPRRARILDAGCGVGRWFWLTAPGREVTGMDFSEPLLERARANEHGVDVVLGDVRDIPTPDGSFEAAYTIKVLQCLRDEDRPTAVAELFRVTEPGGLVVVFEKTRGADGSAAAEWIRWCERAGGRLLAWHPNEYALFDRAVAGFVALVSRALRTGRSEESLSAGAGRSSLAEQHPRAYEAYMGFRALALAASLPLEPLAERVLPGRWAQHGIFVFTK
jgi:SAM-dependent methyltransferase